MLAGETGLCSKLLSDLYGPENEELTVHNFNVYQPLPYCDCSLLKQVYKNKETNMKEHHQHDVWQ